MPTNSPDSDIISTSAHEEKPIRPTSAVKMPASARLRAATVAWRVVRDASTPPTSTPSAPISSSPVSATFASASEVP